MRRWIVELLGVSPFILMGSISLFASYIAYYNQRFDYQWQTLLIIGILSLGLSGFCVYTAYNDQ